MSVALIVATVVLGLAVRFASLGLPFVVVKYGGSGLWALMVYWIVSAIVPAWRMSIDALVSAVLATGIEFVKLYHSPGLDAFRHTLAGVLLLGRFFSWWDIVIYWCAIVLGSFVDRYLRRVVVRH